MIDLQNGTGKKATVAVYMTGTQILMAIYSGVAGVEKSNPFETDEYGRFSFFADPGIYDIQISGTDILPYKLKGISFIGLSIAPDGAYPIKNMYVNADTGKVVIEYDVP